MPKHLRLYIIIILHFLIKISLSQNNQFSVEHYSTKDGLPQNFTHSIIQDKYGLIWIGTQDGLARYDGYTFENFRQDPNNKKSIADNNIMDIICTSDSNLLLITNEGLEKYLVNQNHFVTILKNKQKNKLTNSLEIKTVFEDENSNIWIRDINKLIFYNTKNKEFKEYIIPKTSFHKLSFYNYYSIIKDKQNNIWTGSKDGLLKFDINNKNFTTFKIEQEIINNEVFNLIQNNDSTILVGAKKGIYKFNINNKQVTKIKSSLKFSNARSILKDKNGTLWVGTENGLFFMTKKENKLHRFNIESYIQEINNVGNVIDIMQDASGLIWIGSDVGIFKINTKKKKFNLYKKTKNSLFNFSSNAIYSIFYDDETDLIWFGTRGFGLNIFNKKNNKINVYNSSNSKLKDDNIHCVKLAPNGNIWVGTSNGVFIFNKKKKTFTSFSELENKDFSKYFTNNRISDISFDGDIVWLATFNGLYKYENNKMSSFVKDDTDTSIISNEIFDFFQCKNGDIWIGTLHGLCKLNKTNNTFKRYTKNNNKISTNTVLSIFESSDNTLWIGTSLGLNKYIPEKDSFIFYTTQDHNFKSDYIYSILEDSQKNLWLSTNRGIIKFNIETENVINFSLEDNLQDYEFNIGASFYSKKRNEFFWGGPNGLNSLKPNEKEEKSYIPQAIFTKFIKNHTENGETEIIVKNNKNINLTYKESSIEIHFALPEYTKPSNNKFKYKFDKINSKWIELGSKNSTNFFQLSPGDYTFLLLASNYKGIWNKKPSVLKIHISAAWWHTKIAYIVYLTLILALLYLIYYLLNRRIRHENKILHEKEIVAKKVEKQKEELAIKNNNISESLRYASRIIDEMLPSERYLKTLIPDSFILFMSKDIVSGDFYWVDESIDKIFVAAVDCTGHGVPGAFMSIIGMNILRNTLSKNINTPSEVLDELNLNVASIFKNDNTSSSLKDGMDISIIAIHKYENVIEYSGAINQLFILRDGKIIEYKANRFSISPINTKYGLYKNHIIEVQDNDMLYIFSDGYVDQFGGPDEKKFKYRRFRHLLLNNYHKPVDEQEEILRRVINSWRGKLEQIDDILVMGIRIHTKK